MPRRTVAASVTRMVIFVQATALRYDPNLDFECRSSLIFFLVFHTLILVAKLPRLDHSSAILEHDRSWPRFYSH